MTRGAGVSARTATTGVLIWDVETNQATSLSAFTVGKLKYFHLTPLVGALFQKVIGDGGATFTVIAKAQAPSEQFAGTLLESLFLRGKDSAVTIGTAGTRKLPKTMSGTSHGILETEGGIVAGESSATQRLDIAASLASNASGDTFEDTVTRYALWFIERGYTQVTSSPQAQ